MEDKPLADPDLDKTTSRRSRKDEEGRDFICGCGKRYLSYPALYTHIKTKHEGKMPEGTQKTGTTFIGKRAKSKVEEETLRNINIYSYMEKQDLKILNELQQIFYGSVPAHLRIRKESLPREMYDCFANIIKTQELKVNAKSSLDTFLTVFLLNAGQYVNQKLYDYFLLFAKIARTCYFDHGEQIYRGCFSKPDGGVAYLKEFNVEEGKYFPIVCDFLVRFFIPTAEQNKEYKEVNMSFMELLLTDFCNWMHKQKWTFIKVNLNKQYHLQTVPVVIQKPRQTPIKNDNSADRDKNLESNLSEKKEEESEFDQELEDELQNGQSNNEFFQKKMESPEKEIKQDQEEEAQQPEEQEEEVK